MSAQPVPARQSLQGIAQALPEPLVELDEHAETSKFAASVGEWSDVLMMAAHPTTPIIGVPQFAGRAVYTDVPAPAALPKVIESSLERTFNRLAAEWRSDTYYSSVVFEIAMHKAYQQIIGMGRKVVPLILRELELGGGHWFWALNAITGDDPIRPNATYEDAVQDWLNWGRERGLI